MGIRIIPSKPNSKSVSRYNYCNIIQEDDNYRLETQPPIEIQQSKGDVLYAVQSGEEGRLDKIAHKFYGTPFLWWLIACF